MWWCQSKRISKEIAALLLFDSVLVLLSKSGHKREETEKRRNKGGGGAGEKKKNVLQMLLVSYSTAILNACLLACLATKAEKSNIHFPRLLCI